MKHAFDRAATLRAALMATGSAYISYALGLVVSVLIARKLGPAQYGQYAYVVWLTGLLIMLANHGLNVTGIKFISESMGKDEPEEARRIHGWLRHKQIWSLALVGLGAAAIVPLAQPADWKGPMWLLIGLVTASFGFKALSMFNTSLAKGHGAFVVESATNVVATVFNAAMAVVLALLDAPLLAYLLSFSATSAVYWACSYTMLRKRQLEPGHASPSAASLARLKPHLWWSLWLVLLSVAGARTVETLLINRWLGAAELGYFSVAIGLSRAGVELLVAGLSTVAMPLMGFAFGSGDPQRIQRIFADTTRYYQFLGLLITGGGYFMAEAAITLMYGQRYAPAIPIFQITVMTAGLLLTNGAASAILTNSDNQRFRMGVTLLSFLLSASLAFALIPRYGVVGAALSQSISNVAAVLITYAGIKKYLQLSPPWSWLTRQYAAAAAATLLAVLVQQATHGWLQRWAPGLVFGLCLLAFSLVFKAWRDEEIQHVQDVVDAHPRYLAWLRPLLTLTAKP